MLVYQGSGVATYTYNLVKSLLKYDKKNEYRLFYSSLRRPTHFPYLQELKKRGGKVYDYRFPPKILKLWWNTLHIMPVEWFIGKVDVFHSSDFLRPPLLKGTSGITTMHDLTWKKFPEYHTQDIVKAHERKLKKTIQYSDIILVDSFNTKKDLLFYYPEIVKINSIFVLYLGIDEEFRVIKNTEKIRKVLRKYHIDYPANYLLYVGAIEPRKNLETAIIVFSELIKNKKYVDLLFLIIGKAGWKNKAFFSLIKKLHLTKKIKFIGYVINHDLPYFYNASKVFIYLSLYEGFGLPPLEAICCGTNSLIYKSSSLKEIFPKSYPFTQKKRELETLRYLIDKKPTISRSFFQQFSWKNYTQQFLNAVSK